MARSALTAIIRADQKKIGLVRSSFEDRERACPECGAKLRCEAVSQGGSLVLKLACDCGGVKTSHQIVSKPGAPTTRAKKALELVRSATRKMQRAGMRLGIVECDDGQALARLGQDGSWRNAAGHVLQVIKVVSRF